MKVDEDDDVLVGFGTTVKIADVEVKGDRKKIREKWMEDDQFICGQKADKRRVSRAHRSEVRSFLAGRNHRRIA